MVEQRSLLEAKRVDAAQPGGIDLRLRQPQSSLDLVGAPYILLRVLSAEPADQIEGFVALIISGGSRHHRQHLGRFAGQIVQKLSAEDHSGDLIAGLRQRGPRIQIEPQTRGHELSQLGAGTFRRDGQILLWIHQPAEEDLRVALSGVERPEFAGRARILRQKQDHIVIGGRPACQHFVDHPIGEFLSKTRPRLTIQHPVQACPGQQQLHEHVLGWVRQRARHIHDDRGFWRAVLTHEGLNRRFETEPRAVESGEPGWLPVDFQDEGVGTLAVPGDAAGQLLDEGHESRIGINDHDRAGSQRCCDLSREVAVERVHRWSSARRWFWRTSS